MRILVVDDDPAMRELFRDLLEADGHIPICLPDLPAGPPPRDFDRVVVDLTLPSGAAWAWAAEAGRAVGGAGRVVVTTAAGDDATADRVRRAGHPYLPKPFSPDDLARSLGTAEGGA